MTAEASEREMLRQNSTQQRKKMENKSGCHQYVDAARTRSSATVAQALVLLLTIVALSSQTTNAFSSPRHVTRRTIATAVSSGTTYSSFLLLENDNSRRNQPPVSRMYNNNNKHSTTTSLFSSSKSEEQGLDSKTAVTTTTPSGAGNPPFSVTLDDASKYSYNDAIQRTLAWVGAAIAFGGGVWAVLGAETGQEFFAGYLVEQSLSVDNLFVFLLLFDYFKVPLAYQDRVLNWGIYGAIVMRAGMIGLGAVALQQFHAILLVFAAILVYSSAKIFIGGDEEEEDPSQNSIVKFSRSLIQSTDHFDGDRFFTLVEGVRQATPLFICMIAVEISDVVFAVDSIPAVFGVTENPLVVFSSNIFAIMGLRSLYTILSKAATDLKYLEPAVALVLGFIGSKMIAEYFGYLLPTPIALAVVATVLAGGVGLSVLEKQNELDEEDRLAAIEDSTK